MKKVNLKSMFLVVILVLITIACEKDETILNQDEIVSNQTAFEMPSLVKSEVQSETDPADLQDVYLSPVKLQNEILKYFYDKNGRLVQISYFNRADVTSSTATDELSLIVTDNFRYNNDGRLAVLLRIYNSQTSPGIVSSVRKTYSYDRSGRLVKIVTEKPEITAANTHAMQVETLEYDNSGLLWRKNVRSPRGYHYFLYKHDELRRLKIEALFSPEGFAKYFCEFNYDRKNNISYKEYFYPEVNNEAVSGWIEKYEYDDNPNPFKDLKLPVSTLFERMDMISNNNFTMIANPVKAVHFKYQYELNGYPLLRLRVD